MHIVSYTPTNILLLSITHMQHTFSSSALCVAICLVSNSAPSDISRSINDLRAWRYDMEAYPIEGQGGGCNGIKIHTPSMVPAKY
jgi:hypothetical protein